MAKKKKKNRNNYVKNGKKNSNNKTKKRNKKRVTSAQKNGQLTVKKEIKVEKKEPIKKQDSVKLKEQNKKNDNKLKFKDDKNKSKDIEKKVEDKKIKLEEKIVVNKQEEVKEEKQKVIEEDKNKKIEKQESVKENKRKEEKLEQVEIKEELKKESKPKKRRKIRLLVILAILCLGLGILLMVPYGTTVYNSEASGKVLDVPKFVKLKEECCNYSATFSSIRSAWSLKQDLDEIIAKYQVLECNNKSYYYNEESDYTIVSYGIRRRVIFNEIYINYGKGNSCNIDTKFKKLELLPDDFSLMDAKKDGNYVIENGKVYNKNAYSEFMENVKNKVASVLRIVKETKEGDVVITDLEYMSNGKFKVTYDGTRDRNNEDRRSITAYRYEKIGMLGNKFYAYNGEQIVEKGKIEDVYYLLELEND